MLAELEGRGVCDRDFGVGTASWVAAETRAPRVRVSVAGAVGDPTAQAVGGRLRRCRRAGSVSAHANALGDAVANPRVGDLIADLEAELVEAAQHCPFEIWKRDLTVLVELLDQDGGYDPNQDLAANTLHASLVGDARLVISGELVGENALVVAQALNMKADELARQLPQRPQPDRRRRHARRVQRCSLWRWPNCAGPDWPPTPPSPEPPTPTSPWSSAPKARRPSTTNPVRYVLPDWFGRDDERPGLFTVDGDRLTTLERYQHLLCDAGVTALIVDSLGVPLDLGQSVRLATPAQRRALAVRDGGCVFPGCDAPVSWCDAHHVDWYEHGGPTDIANLALLCRRHHGITHRHGWTMTTTPDQHFTWTTPTGHTLHSQRHLGRPPPGQ